MWVKTGRRCADGGGIIALSSLRQQRSHGLKVGVPCLVQRNVEDPTEVDRVGCPELIGPAQLCDRDPVFQGDARESIVWRDLGEYEGKR